MRFRRQSASRAADNPFNLTPLIDVLFIILVFLILSTSFRETNLLGIKLPGIKTENKKPNFKDFTVNIRINSDKTIQFNQHPIGLDDLAVKLSVIADPQTRVLVVADESVDHGTVVKVLSVVKNQKLTNVGIAVENDRSSETK